MKKNSKSVPKNEVVLSQEEIDDFKKMMENAETITVSPEAFDKLQQLINEPPKPSEALKRLMSTKPRYTIRK